MRKLAALLLLGAVASIVMAGPPGLTFHAPYDGTVAASPGPDSQRVHGEVSYISAPDGQGALLVNGSYLSYSSAGYFAKSAGTLSLWIQPQWHGSDAKRYAIFSDTAPTHKSAYNFFYLFKTSSATLQFSVGNIPEQSVSTTVADWAAGEWHHLAVAWNCTWGITLYVDGTLAGEKRFAYEPQQWPAFNIGADYDGSLTAAAAFSDVRIFDRMLRPDQVAAVAQGMPLEVADIIEMTAPDSISAGEEFTLHLRALANEPLTRPHAVLITLADIPLASVMPHPAAATWRPGQPVELEPITVKMPDYIQLARGQYSLAAILEGAATSSPTAGAAALVSLLAPARSAEVPVYELRGEQVYYKGAPWLPSQPGSGFLYEGHFYRDDEDGRPTAVKLYQSGRIRDALRCVAVDEVEVAGDDTAASHILRNSPDTQDGAASPHLLVVEMAHNIAYSFGLEVLAAGGRQLEDHFLVWAALNPTHTRTARARESFLFYPQAGACEVRFTRLAAMAEPREGVIAPVRWLGVYKLLDYPVGNVNVAELPDKPLRRSLALLPAHSELIYDGFGSSGKDRMQRQYSLRHLLHYMRFVGFDRLQLYAAGSDMQSFYDGGMLPNAWRWDLFEDILPLAVPAGIDIVPLLPSLSNFDRLFTFSDPDSFQMDINGKLILDAAGHRCPDPLRREVEKQLLAFLDEFCARTDGYGCVSAIGLRVDGATGTCFASVNDVQTADKVGYSASDLQRFQVASGIAVPSRTGTPLEAYYWLKNSPQAWQRWLDFRCAHMHSLWTKCRDLVVSRDPSRYLLVDTALPVPANRGDYSQLELLRHHGYDPRLFAEEHGIRIAVSADYRGPDRPDYATAEGMEVQIECAHLSAGRELLAPLLQAIVLDNPYCLTLRSSLDAKAGHEWMLRGFARAFRALPAVPPKDFDGKIWPVREGIRVQWFDDCLAVINSTDQSQQVRITLKEPLPFNTQVIDMATGQRVPLLRGRSTLRLIVNTNPYDLRTLKVKKPITRPGTGILHTLGSESGQ